MKLGMVGRIFKCKPLSLTGIKRAVALRIAQIALAIAGASAGAPVAAEAPVNHWNSVQIAELRHWVSDAPRDALPLLDTKALNAAQLSSDSAAADRAATDLALRLARMHLLGCAGPAQRAGWRIKDSDESIDLSARLTEALASGEVDSFFESLRPRHPDYVALRAAYADEADPQRRTSLARNMERWRWMPQSLGNSYILVNAATFEARLWRDGKQAGTWPVIVGKRSTPTPVFAATVKGVILNPWWVVPASIVREMRGRFPASKGYVRSGGRIMQRPGPGNALGQMKLDMPNAFTVYMHDTPGKHLFGREVRTFSHGCIRTGNALDFAATLLDGVMTREEVDAIVATGQTTNVALASGLPIYITYFTAGIRGDGELAIMDDVYNRDSRVGAAEDAHRTCGG